MPSLAVNGARLAAMIPNARLITVPGANHYTILFDLNAQVLREVQRFLFE